MSEFPSQHREGVDHVYAALTAEPQSLAKVVEAASGIDRDDIRIVLKLAGDGGVAEGTNGKWALNPVKRTGFRDGVVLAWFTKQKEPATMAAAIKSFEGLMSFSQLYNSVARLRADDPVLFATRDGSRSPRYSTTAPTS